MTNAETQVGDPAVEAEVGVEDSSSIEDAEISASVRYEISSYGADYPVDGLVKRISRGDIYVPEFQRGFVWTHAQSSRFIESLLLGLPVPGIFLFKEPETQRLVVVDGQQRLRTLQTYYHGIIRGREFALRGVSEELNDLTYKSLPEDDRRRLDDAIVHATIFQQEDPQDDLSSIYLVFERLNTGGTPLVEQEIRSCVYPGPFNDLLEELAAHPKWREIYGSPRPHYSRLAADLSEASGIGRVDGGFPGFRYGLEIDVRGSSGGNAPRDQGLWAAMERPSRSGRCDKNRSRGQGDLDAGVELLDPHGDLEECPS